MKSLWKDEEAAEFAGDLGLRVYTSRLLGRDRALVLHGGGNTSVKIVEKDAFGQDEEILYVKGSGWDMETIEAAGFSPVRLEYVRRLVQLQSMSDTQMVNELLTHMTSAKAPAPSVETILHAILPHKFVDHTHADAILAITNTADGEARVREIYGDCVVIVPYVMPGFDLARLSAERFRADAGADTIGMVLLKHGIFSFGSTARESYDRMIMLVDRAESYLRARGAWDIPVHGHQPHRAAAGPTLAEIRKELSAVAGWPVVLERHTDDKYMSFVQRADLADISQQGPATPDHVIRTKRLPMIGRDARAYAESYRGYFAEFEPRARARKIMIDPAPRVMLDPELGMCTCGRTAKDASIAADIYDHTIDIILRATALGGYKALPPLDIFDMEYWDLEQAKLGSARPLMFAGEVALVTGGASGIGKACVQALLSRGAAVVAADVNPAIKSMYQRPDFMGLECDVTTEEAISHLLDQACDAFGGLDMLILNAGIFPDGRTIDKLKVDEWHRVMRINLDANMILMRECYPLLKLAPRGGRVVVIGSKNVPAPGPGAAAYSTSKAALNQLARVAALEWGGAGIRINSLHPNAVFDTGIWTDEVLASRARNYGLTVDEYKKNNVLGTEVTSRDVAELAAEMCGPLFAKTTAAQVPVDGGNDRVI